MPVLARFTNFLDFYGFHKAVAAAFLGISETLTVTFEHWEGIIQNRVPKYSVYFLF